MSISDLVIAGIILMVLWWARDIILIAAIFLGGVIYALVMSLFGK